MISYSEQYSKDNGETRQLTSTEAATIASVNSATGVEVSPADTRSRLILLSSLSDARTRRKMGHVSTPSDRRDEFRSFYSLLLLDGKFGSNLLSLSLLDPQNLLEPGAAREERTRRAGMLVVDRKG